jgi:hypothetical protein
MKTISIIAILLIASAHLWAITTQEELLSVAKDADLIVCIRITAHPKPKVSVISVWKPDDSISQELSIHQIVNTFIENHPYLNPPKYDHAFLLLSKISKGDSDGPPISFARVTSVDIENHSLVFGGHKMPLEDAKRLIQSSLQRAERDAAANP